MNYYILLAFAILNPIIGFVLGTMLAYKIVKTEANLFHAVEQLFLIIIVGTLLGVLFIPIFFYLKNKYEIH
jgi:hypothetical protein